MNSSVQIQEKVDPIAGFVFVTEGAQTLLGRLCEDEAGKPYLEPVYVYRVVEEWPVNEKGDRLRFDDRGEKLPPRFVRSLHPLYGYPEILRKDLFVQVGTSVNELLPRSRDELIALVDDYEAKLRRIGIVRLVKPGRVGVR